MNVVVTGGGTIAPIDEIRHISNTSTGRLSARITEACLARGATVWHVHAPTAQLPYEREAGFDLRADPDAEFRRLAALQRRWRLHKDRLRLQPLGTGTVAEYARTLDRVFRQHPIDVAFLAMAVSDYEPEPVAGKIPSGDQPLTLTLHPTPKVIRSVREWAPEVYLVGFKLMVDVPDASLIRTAEAACRASRADAIVANDYRTVREGRHRILLVRPGQREEVFDPDEDIADALVERVFSLARRHMADRDPIALDPPE